MVQAPARPLPARHAMEIDAQPRLADDRCTRKLKRFSLRGRRKVNNQWWLYGLVHNIGKIQRYGKFDSPRKQT